jgi:LuxR family maltose regulon positive regulatory protein
VENAPLSSLIEDAVRTDDRAMAAAGDVVRALASLSEALALAHPEGYIQIFADEGVEMRALLVRLVAAQRDEEGWGHRVPLDYLGRLMRALDAAGSSAVTPARHRGAGVPGLVEPLSEREVEVHAATRCGQVAPRNCREIVRGA